jgi:hypothetical protein
MGFPSATDEAALVGEIEGKRLFGRPGHRWQDSFKVDLVLTFRHCASYI